MRSIILSTATRFIFAILLLFSLFLLFKGHDEPGGGFTGGLVAAASFALYGLAFDMKTAQFMLHIHPRNIIALGLLFLTLGASLALLVGEPFLAAVRLPIYIPAVGNLGSPLLFEIGVYLTVTGVALMIIFSLSEDE